MENVLKSIYYDPESGFCSAQELLSRAQLVDKSINASIVKHWLTGQQTYTLHKNARRHYPRNRVLVSSIDEQWQADLVDLSSLSKFNDNNKFLLTCIDLFSKFGFTEPVKTKAAGPVQHAFQKMLITSGRKPQKLQTDAGTEFLNKDFQRFLKQNDIVYFNTKSELKASVVERFNRSIKTRMWRYFTENNTYRYIDVLPKLLIAYNTSRHRTIGMAPNEVTKKNEVEILQKCYRKSRDDVIIFKFNVGDKVRINKCKHLFEKGYTENWSREIFIIEKCLARQPPVYRIRDQMGEIIQGIFYDYELQKVDPSLINNVYVIEKILKTRVKNGIKQYYVKYKNYPSKFNDWTENLVML